ncbi:MAG TPA: flagellar motor switch protein FliM [Clostridiaceae bacterium]|nr:flagellar motor switch protein FliM [Clostridiaceae bacterium]
MEILSQSEIDELLKALNTGELDVQQIKASTQEKKIRTHDFRRPSKFAKEHLKTLNIIYDNYARNVTNYLTGYLRTVVQIDVINVESIAYLDFNNSISNPVIMAIIEFLPLSGSVILEMEPTVAFALIERILGGKGITMRKNRDFTEIELAIIEKVIRQLLNLMPEPWENVIPINPILQRIETNAQFAQVVSQHEMVALITLKAKIGEVEGIMNVCIPYLVVEPIIPKLSTKFWFSVKESKVSDQAKTSLENRIKNTEVLVRAILGKSEITIRDFLDLQKGDVLPLDTNVDGDLEIFVDGITKFYAKPGVRKNKIALRITKVLRREDELNE